MTVRSNQTAKNDKNPTYGYILVLVVYVVCLSHGVVYLSHGVVCLSHGVVYLSHGVVYLSHGVVYLSHGSAVRQVAFVAPPPGANAAHA
jgi:hypothetical protein